MALSPSLDNKKPARPFSLQAYCTSMNLNKQIGGGERGVRTLDTLPYTHFPGVRLRPLGHLSYLSFPLKNVEPLRINQINF